MARMKQTENPDTVPTKMYEIFEELTNLTNGFCSQYLNKEYAEVIRKALAALCRKRISPFQSGNTQTWAAGVVHAICMVNFGFDKSQNPSTSAKDLCT